MESKKEVFSLGEFIINMRKEKGYSQRKFAQISGLSNTTISRIENGETMHPDIETLRLLAKHLGIDEASLINMVNSSKTKIQPKRDVRINFLKRPVRRINRSSSVFSASPQRDEAEAEAFTAADQTMPDTIFTAETPKEKAQGRINLKGMRLITLRLEKNITQKELADILGIDKTLISQFEGEIIKPEYEIVEKLAEFFEVTTEYLCGISDMPVEEKAEIKESPKAEAVITDLKPVDLKPEYIALALELQNANIAPEDIRAFINILNKYR
ncbi:MAG: immunity repressor protein [Clostridia bacterium]|nr:immunity repressor protein [Clostridia bacterium]